MKSIIVGGGKIGYNLFKTLQERGYGVVLIERDQQTCTKIAEEIEGDVIWGDGTDFNVLKEAGIEEAEIVAAVTGTDEENLVICQIAKTCFQIKKTIARVNNPKNVSMFKSLGIDTTVCSTEVIANLIQHELHRNNYRIVNTFERGSMILVEIVIDENSTWADHYVKDLLLPKECVIVSILHGEKVIYPRGETWIVSNDKVLVLTNHGVLSSLMKGINPGGTSHEKQKR